MFVKRRRLNCKVTGRTLCRFVVVIYTFTVVSLRKTTHSSHYLISDLKWTTPPRIALVQLYRFRTHPLRRRSASTAALHRSKAPLSPVDRTPLPRHRRLRAHSEQWRLTGLDCDKKSSSKWKQQSGEKNRPTIIEKTFHACTEWRARTHAKPSSRRVLSWKHPPSPTIN